MPNTKRRKSLYDFSGEMNINVSKMLPVENEVVLMVNMDTEVLGKLKPRLGNTKMGDTLTSSTSTTTSTTTTSTSTTTS